MTNYLRFVFFFIIAAFIAPLYAQNAFGPLPGQPEMSPAKMQQFQKEMEEFQKEFDALSPEEQDSFFKSMDEAVKKIDDLSKTPEGKELLNKLEKGTISDSELDSLINQLVEEEEPKPKQEVAEPKKEEKEPEIPKQILTTAHEKIIDALNSFIAHTNAFIVKAATIPEMPSKVKRWERRKQIKLKEKQTWNDLKTAIEQLVDKIGALLERDPVTKEYYHIDELLKQETLHNNIVKVQKNIAKMEPLAQEMPLLEVKKMSKDSKNAYQLLINEYYEALYILNIVDEIKKLFSLFDPKAKKYRELEEKAAKQAELLGKPIVPPTRGVGVSPTPSYGRPHTPTEPSYRPYRAAQPYTPPLREGRPTGPYSPSLKEEDIDKKKTAAPSVKKKEEKDIKEDKEKDKEKEPQEMKAHIQRNKDIDAALSKIEEHLKKASDLIKSNELVNKLDTTFIDSSPVDLSLAVEILPDLNKALNIKKGILGEMHQLHRKLKTAPNRQAARKQLLAKYNKGKKELTTLREKLETIAQEWDSFQQKIPAYKKYAYFGMTDIDVSVPEGASQEQLRTINAQKEQLEQTKSKVFAPYSLLEINDLIKKIEQTIKDFDKPKLPTEK